MVCRPPSCAARTRTRASRASTVERRAERRGRRRRVSGADLVERVEGDAAVRGSRPRTLKQPMHRPLATDKARYVGEAVAIVVAADRERSRRTPPSSSRSTTSRCPPSSTSRPRSRKARRSSTRSSARTTAHVAAAPAASDVDEAFAEADVTVKQRYRQQRLVPNAIEPRGVVAQYRRRAGRVHALVARRRSRTSSGSGSPGVLGIPETKLRVIAPDVGGGFGSKLNVYAEEALRAVLARASAGRSSGSRSAARGLAVDDPRPRPDPGRRGRGHRRRDDHGRAGARVRSDFGAYLPARSRRRSRRSAWLLRRARTRSRRTAVEIVGVFTNKMPTDAYRGAGRPEATYLIERPIDASPHELDLDPVEVRRKNFDPRSFPYTTAGGADVRQRRLRAGARQGARSCRATTRSGASRRSAASAAARCSASGSRPTSRSAGSARRGCRRDR